MKSRGTRLIFNFLVPPIFGALIVGVPIAIAESGIILSVEGVLDMLGGLAGFIFLALIFMGLQSIIYSLIMEFIILPIATNYFQYVIGSTFLGIIAGLGTFGNREMATVGGVVGMLAGLISYNLVVSNNTDA